MASGSVQLRPTVYLNWWRAPNFHSSAFIAFFVGASFIAEKMTASLFIAIAMNIARRCRVCVIQSEGQLPWLAFRWCYPRRLFFEEKASRVDVNAANITSSQFILGESFYETK